MNGAEALSFLILNADQRIGQDPAPLTEAENEQLKLAVAICTAILNTALPVARFRVHVSVDTKTWDKKGKPSGSVHDEFTVSGVTIQACRQGIAALKDEIVECQVTLWEQRATGAEMLSGFQGKTKTIEYRKWLKQIDQFQTSPTVQ